MINKIIKKVNKFPCILLESIMMTANIVRIATIKSRIDQRRLSLKNLINRFFIFLQDKIHPHLLNPQV